MHELNTLNFVILIVLVCSHAPDSMKDVSVHHFLFFLDSKYFFSIFYCFYTMILKNKNKLF